MGRFVIHALLMLALAPSLWAAPASGPEGKVTTLLRDVIAAEPGAARTARALVDHPLVTVNERGEVFLTLRLARWNDTDRAELEALGASFGIIAPEVSTAEAWVAPGDILAVAGHPAISQVRPVYPAAHNVGAAVTEGDSLMRADLVRRLGYDGSGTSVGVISDGVQSLLLSQQAGELPYGVTVLVTAAGFEGTPMLEIVHDLAPEARLFFGTASPSALNLRQRILDLADAGCDVIVDDVAYYDEPCFEDGPVAQAINEVVSQGVVYCTSAGNGAESYYQGSFTPAGPGSKRHAWDAVADSGMALTLPAGANVAVYLHWSEATGGASSDYDLYLYAEPQLVAPLAASTDAQTGSEDPLETIWYENATTRERVVYVAVKLEDGDPRDLKIIVWRGGTLEYPIRRGSVSGHSMAQGALSIAAVHAEDEGQDDIASYSSRGPVQVAVPTPEIRLKPDLTAIAGVTHSGVAGFPNPFYGTSAAAPHVAGVAALLLSAHPDWTPADVRDVLTRNARDLGEPGWDGTFGYGMVDAYAALETAATETTDVRGTIATTTWTAFGGPYRVTGSITVPSGETLTIEPGVDVLFDRDVPFVVEGSLVANGTESDSVRFLPGDASEWGGIRFVGRRASSLAFVRISGALAEGVRPDYLGGGLYAEGLGTELTMTRCVISGNRAAWGGGVYVRDSARVHLADCTIRDNVATDTGGGVRLAFCPDTIRFERCSIAGNRALVGLGGGIAARDAAIVLEGCEVSDNVSPDNAGGCDLLDCVSLITDCEFSGNSAAYVGGGLCVTKGTTRIDGGTISANTAGGNGGGVMLDRGENWLVGCFMAHNHAGSARGGAAYASGGSLSIERCTIARNTADDCGGVAVVGAETDIVGSLIIWNEAGDLDAESSTAHTTYSFVSPEFDPMLTDTAAGDWSPLPGSPLIDAGDPAGPLDADATIADIGAFAYSNPNVPVWYPTAALAADIGQRVTFSVAAEDPLGGTLVYRATSLPAGAGFDPPTRTMDWQPGASQVGEHVCEFSATNDSGTVYRRVTLVVLAPPEVTDVDEPALPGETALPANVPNPFNPTTTITFSLAQPGNVTVAVYDLQGRRVRVLAEGSCAAGARSVTWNGRDGTGRDVGSGVYLLRLETPDARIVRRMTLVR